MFASSSAPADVSRHRAAPPSVHPPPTHPVLTSPRCRSSLSLWLPPLSTSAGESQGGRRDIPVSPAVPISTALATDLSPLTSAALAHLRCPPRFQSCRQATLPPCALRQSVSSRPASTAGSLSPQIFSLRPVAIETLGKSEGPPTSSTTLLHVSEATVRGSREKRAS